jgi:hypothetical protein
LFDTFTRNLVRADRKFSLEVLTIDNYKSIYEDNKENFRKVYSLIKEGDLESLKAIFTVNPEFVYVPMYGGVSLNNKNLLHFASSYGSGEICLLLIESGIDVNATDNFYITPIEVAATKGRFELVKLLISKGARVDGDCRCALTPLISAVSNGHTEIVNYLIKKGADVNRLQANFNRSALEFARGEEMASLLKSNGALKSNEVITLSSERASGVIAHIHHNAGSILSTKLSEGSIDISAALLSDDKKYKVLFTIGLFEKIPRIELMMCLRHSWVVNKELSSENHVESFPVQMLFSASEYVLADGELQEGTVIEKRDSKWKHLVWPKGIDALIVINYEFSKEAETFEASEDVVVLLLLVPIKFPKAGCPRGKKLEDWIKRRRTAKWSRNALKHEHLDEK